MIKIEKYIENTLNHYIITNGKLDLKGINF